MTGYSNNTRGRQRWEPLMVMPNGRAVWMQVEEEERKPRRSEMREATQHHAGDCIEEQVKFGSGQAKAKSVAHA
jgi:hypothetical protein